MLFLDTSVVSTEFLIRVSNRDLTRDLMQWNPYFYYYYRSRYLLLCCIVCGHICSLRIRWNLLTVRSRISIHGLLDRRMFSTSISLIPWLIE